ncbi:hypothetical protein TCON_2748, partial [Astathelohania contejeani]
IQIISIKLMFNDADDARTDITELPIQLLYSFKEISNLISCDIIEYETICDIFKLLKIRCMVFCNSKIEASLLNEMIHFINRKYNTSNNKGLLSFFSKLKFVQVTSLSKVQNFKIDEMANFINDNTNDINTRGVYALFYSYFKYSRSNPELCEFLVNTFFIYVISNKKDFNMDINLLYLKNKHLIFLENYFDLKDILGDLLLHTITNFTKENMNYFKWIRYNTENPYFIINSGSMINCLLILLKNDDVLYEASSVFAKHLTYLIFSNDSRYPTYKDSVSIKFLIGMSVSKIFNNISSFLKYTIKYNTDCTEKIINRAYSICKVDEVYKKIKKYIDRLYESFIEIEACKQKIIDYKSYEWISLILSFKPEINVIKNMIYIIAENNILKHENELFEMILKHISNELVINKIEVYSCNDYMDIFIFLTDYMNGIYIYHLMQPMKECVKLYFMSLDVNYSNIHPILQILLLNSNLSKIMKQYAVDYNLIIDSNQQESYRKLISENISLIMKSYKKNDFLANLFPLFDYWNLDFDFDCN